MSFDKYLFEKYIKDCAVEILLPGFLNKGTGFWVLPDGHILTCYHILIPKKKDILGRVFDVENIDIETVDIKIRYRGKEYAAKLDREHSKKELDIAVLAASEIIEKIHFVPLGEPELNTEVQVFGYRVDENSITFKNGYHISGTLRSGQVLSEGGLVYNLETNQPPNSSVEGMSGAPVYDTNIKRVVGFQYGQEDVGPSICYVHPIAKVYKLWPELRLKNFNSIRKDFNIYFMASDLPRSIFILSMGLLQSQLENSLGKEAVGAAEQTLVNVSGEKVTGKLNKILGTRLGTKKLIGAILRANKFLYNNCANSGLCDIFRMPISNSTLLTKKSFHTNCINGGLCDAFTIPIGDLLSTQAAVNDLPKVFDQDGALKTISESLRCDYSELTETQIEAGLILYLECLKKELSPLKDFILSIITQDNKQINQYNEENENKLNNVFVNLEKYSAQRGIYMLLDDIHTGFGMSTGEEEDKEMHARTSMLEEILNREAPRLSVWLRSWMSDEQPAYFLQQVYSRINNDGEISLKQAIERLLTERHQPWLAKYLPRKNESIKHPYLSKLEPSDSFNIAFTPDGKRVISFASTARTLYLWDVESGQSFPPFEGRASGIVCAVITADGKSAIFSSSDKSIRRWDMENNECEPIFNNEMDHIWSIAIIPKTQHAIMAFSKGTLHLRNLETGQTHRVFEGHTEPCSSIAMLSDGKFFMSASGDGTLRLWDTDTGRLLRTFNGHSEGVSSVSIIPNSKQIVSASADCTLRLWDIPTGKSLHIFEGHADRVHGVVTTPDGKSILSASADKTLRLWDVSTGKCLSILTGDEPFKCCAIAPNGSLIAAGDQAGEIHFIEIRN